MGDYLQVADLKDYFPEERIIALAQGNPATETLVTLEPATQSRLEAAITNAESKADGFLQGRFPLPITPVTKRLKLAIGELAIYYLFSNRREIWATGTRNPFQGEYDTHVEWLEGVKETEMFIGSAAVAASEDILTTADDGNDRQVFGSGGIDDF